MSHADFVVVRTYLNKFDAQVAKSALEAADIDSVIRADDAGGNATGLWMSGIRLLVNAADVERAKEILGNGVLRSIDAE